MTATITKPDREAVPELPAEPGRTGYLELVQTNADFRWLWFGQIVSLLGDWFNLIASIALISSLTNSGVAVGSLFVVRMLAPFLTSPIAGVVADRCSRRQILIIADLVRALVVLCMLLVRSRDTVWLLYVLTALQMGTSAFFFTARNAILPDIVSKQGLGTANAISGGTWSVMLAIGAALGGLTAGFLGSYTAFTIDAGTFCLSAILIAQIRKQPARERPATATLTAAFRDYAQGLHYLAKHPDVLAITFHKAALTMLLGTTFRVVQSAVAERVFPIGEQGGIAMGLMFAAAGIGTGVGPIVGRYFTGDRPPALRFALLCGYALGAIGVGISSTLWSFPTMIVGAFIGGLGNGILWVFSTQLLMQSVDQQIRGRVFGTEFAMFTLASATSSGIVGAALDSQLTISTILCGMATLALLPATAWLAWLLVRARLSLSTLAEG